MELTLSNGIYCKAPSRIGLPGPTRRWEVDSATLLLDQVFGPLLLLHELGLGLLKTLTVYLEKLKEIVVLSGMLGLFCVPHKQPTFVIGHMRILLSLTSQEPTGTG